MENTIRLGSLPDWIQEIYSSANRERHGVYSNGTDSFVHFKETFYFNGLLVVTNDAGTDFVEKISMSLLPDWAQKAIKITLRLISPSNQVTDGKSEDLLQISNGYVYYNGRIVIDITI